MSPQVEHVRVLQEALNLQNVEIDRIRKEKIDLEARKQSLERAVTRAAEDVSLVQSLLLFLADLATHRLNTSARLSHGRPGPAVRTGPSPRTQQPSARSKTSPRRGRCES